MAVICPGYSMWPRILSAEAGMGVGWGCVFKNLGRAAPSTVQIYHEHAHMNTV